MHAKFIRLFRTATSERFVLHDDGGSDIGLLDLHFLADGTVAGSLFLLQKKVREEADMREILDQIDEELVPTASLKDANLTFTVTQGELVGTFSSEEDG